MVLAKLDSQPASGRNIRELRPGLSQSAAHNGRVFPEAAMSPMQCVREPWRAACTLTIVTGTMVFSTLVLTSGAAHASEAEDRRILGALDQKYQLAVKDNDARTMAAILADNFVLVEGDGKRSSKADLINSATDGKTHYEHQEDSERKVLLFGDTAVVTAKLWAKGLEDGANVDYTLWFSDVYVRTPAGWRYVFGQASLPLPSKVH
jgi:ketosteroid isomerase-like protein